MNEQELIKGWEKKQELKLIWEEIWPLKPLKPAQLTPTELIEVRPLSPPSGILLLNNE